MLTAPPLDPFFPLLPETVKRERKGNFALGNFETCRRAWSERVRKVGRTKKAKSSYTGLGKRHFFHRRIEIPLCGETLLPYSLTPFFDS